MWTRKSALMHKREVSSALSPDWNDGDNQAPMTTCPAASKRFFACSSIWRCPFSVGAKASLSRRTAGVLAASKGEASSFLWSLPKGHAVAAALSTSGCCCCGGGGGLLRAAKPLKAAFSSGLGSRMKAEASALSCVDKRELSLAFAASTKSAMLNAAGDSLLSGSATKWSWFVCSNARSSAEGMKTWPCPKPGCKARRSAGATDPA
mmetsp:Transcript_9265/g.16695  ORF Transcript_9265/g.16695 Transcript_9265/m.16695 type:complete len:206 (-) Transcript_9265:457-1074(-)